jgi:hypothetical protein
MITSAFRPLLWMVLLVGSVFCFAMTIRSIPGQLVSGFLLVVVALFALVQFDRLRRQDPKLLTAQLDD